MASSTLTDEVMLNLKIISKLANPENAGSKLYLRTVVAAISKPGWFSGLGRTLWGESRETAMEYLHKTYHSCFQIIEIAMHSNYMQASADQEKISAYQKVKASEIVAVLSALATELDSSLVGIDSMLLMYCDDSTLTSRLEILKTKAQFVIMSTRRGVETSTTKLGIPYIKPER